MGKLFNGKVLTFHNYKGTNYLRSIAMRMLGKSHGYDYYIPEANGNFRYFPTYEGLKEFINLKMEVEEKKKKLARLGA